MASKKGYDMVAAAKASTLEPAELVWFGQAALLKDFPEQYQTPNMVKIVQGEYMNLAPKYGNSSDDGKENELLIYSVETTTKALGINLRVKDGRGVIQTDNKLSIPLSYEGWFEVLSEDGRRVKPIENIKDLMRVFPHTCLVRKPINALITQPDGSVKNETTRTVNIGETMILFGLVQLSLGPNGEPVKYVKCLDAKGNALYFHQDQEGLFSPVAGKENISGVHTIKGILNKFHLPVTCKLVHGSYPKNVDKHKFSGIMRIVYVYDERHAFVCPASGNYRMLPIPTEVPMKVVPAVNFDEIRQTTIIKKVLERCQSMVKCYQNSIHLLYDVDVLPTPKGGDAKKKKNDLAEEVIKETETEHDSLYDEIEDIYFYVVRHGVSPPAIPKRLYKEGEQDNDFWDQPIFKTLHKQRERDSIAKMRNDSDDTKIFRFYHEEDNQTRPMAYVKTGNKVDQPVELTQTPVQQRLITRRSSDRGPSGQDQTQPRKERRKSQPAIFRFFANLAKSRDDRDSAGTSKSSNNSSDYSGGGRQQKPRNKPKNMYL